ncbi:MAG: hypothetical protein FJZ96_15660, partial [Chloroflexi bacterium]|nr:hypothetical protein [Chloroflexota bacterium]
MVRILFAQVKLSLWVIAVFTLAACNSKGPSATPEVAQLTIAQVRQEYAAYEGQLVKVSGYRVVMAMFPLCPGYVGFDKRTAFIDAGEDSIEARIDPSVEVLDTGDTPRTFLAYVRVFRGQVGCPGSVVEETFPYLA